MSKLQITVEMLVGADHKKVFAVETTHCESVCNVITLPFWCFRGVALDWLLMLAFQQIKTVCVSKCLRMTDWLHTFLRIKKDDEYDRQRWSLWGHILKSMALKLKSLALADSTLFLIHYKWAMAFFFQNARIPVINLERPFF